MLQQAGFFADRLRAVSPDPARQVDAAFELAFGRPARPDERDALVQYARGNGLAAACRLLLNANEFAYVD